MNAKKIMGAVLVALLAVTAFAGVAAADQDYGTVFLYQNGLSALEGTWTNGDKIVVVSSAGIVTAGENFAPGTYTKGKDTVYVTYPTATYSAFGEKDGKKYAVQNNGIVYTGDEFTLEALPANCTVANLSMIGPNGVPEVVADNYFDGIDSLAPGTYVVKAIFDNTSFAPYVPESLLTDTMNSFTFKVVKAGDATMTASADTVIIGKSIILTIVGQPGVEYDIDAPGFSFEANQPSGVDADGKFQMPNDGKVEVYATAGSVTGEYTITLNDDASVDVEIVAGTLTAEAKAPSYYIGNDIELLGTTTAGDGLDFYIKGTNTDLELLEGVEADVEEDGTWTADVDGDDIRALKLDAGTYTIYVTVDGEGVEKIDDFKTYATVSVALKQPFISITSAPDVVIQGGEAKIKGTAEATNKVGYYIFGTNYFKADNQTTSVKDGQFTITLGKSLTKNMSAGQYFVVVQHKMYDNLFNIWAEVENDELTGDIISAPTVGTDALGAQTTLFNVYDRQKANAAQALCDALDTENIDDMYVKLSFVVAGPSSVINSIPEEVVKGEKLTVSGTANGLAGEVVTVEMLSTAFAAVPKSTVGSASFISLTTKVSDDGTWEVTFDTSGLNVDEYTVSAAVGQFDATTAKVNVVEAADKPDTPDTPDVPDTPDTPDTPTEPETPGFGALAALAGLGAVAVLLLRRE